MNLMDKLNSKFLWFAHLVKDIVVEDISKDHRINDVFEIYAQDSKSAIDRILKSNHKPTTALINAITLLDKIKVQKDDIGLER